MKKIYFITALLLTLMVGASSCSREEKDIFEASAADRLESIKGEYAKMLCDKGGKWTFNYFANSSEQGYMFVVEFNANGSVKMSSKTIFNSDDLKSTKFKSETSLWEVIADDGPVLTFNSYNTLFHLFSDPFDNPITEDVDEDGRGHEGDYEFMIMGEENDTLKLKGKKHGLDLCMVRLAQDVNEEQYFGQIDSNFESMFSVKFPEVIFESSNGERYIMSNMAQQIFHFYPEGGDAITETIKIPGVVTTDGVYLLTPFKGKNEAFSAQNFVKLEDGTLACTDDAGARIYGFGLNYLFTQNETYKWKKKGATGELSTLYDGITTDSKAYNGSSLQYMQFDYDEDLGQSVVVMRFKLKKAGQYLSCKYPVTFTLDGESNVKMAIDLNGADANSKTFCQKNASMTQLFNTLNAATATMTSSSLLCPKLMEMTVEGHGTMTFDIQ